MKLLPVVSGSFLATVFACAACSGDSIAPSAPVVAGDDDAGIGALDDAGGGADAGSNEDASAGETDADVPDTGTPPDAGPKADAGGDAGTGCGAFKYCDGFESYSGPVGAKLGPWTSSVGGTGTVITVDTTKAFRGTKSLHISVPAGAAAHATLNQKATAGLVTGNDLFGRAMVFYSNAGGNGLPIGVHSWLFNADGTSTVAGGAVHLNMGGGGAKMQLNYHAPPPRAEQSVQGGTMMAGAWHCVQWQYDGSGTPVKDAAKVWVDGAIAVDVPIEKGWDLATPWSSMDFGFTHYQTLANGVDVYLDEFAVDGAMVACP